MISFKIKHLIDSNGALQLDEQVRASLGLSEYELMKQAASAATSLITSSYPKAKFLILTGPGNNGGDGWEIAANLSLLGFEVLVFEALAQHCSKRAAIQAKARALSLGVGIISEIDDGLLQADVVIDAILGVGPYRSLGKALSTITQAVNKSAAHVCAIDVPTGVCASTGSVCEHAIQSNMTIRFFAQSVGLSTGSAKSMAGQQVVLALGASDRLIAQYAVKSKLIYGIPTLPAPKLDLFKHRKGHVVVIGGSTTMMGASVLSARAAQMTGAGLVSLLCDPVSAANITAVHSEIMTPSRTEANDMITGSTVVVFGPGIRLDQDAVGDLELAIKQKSVIDASGLRLLALQPKHCPYSVLTPHSGEAAALLNCSVEAVESDRVAAAKNIALKYSATVVLKGPGTVICDANKSMIISAGNPALAVAGSGDILAGVIAAFIGMGLTLFEAAAVGSFIHARAGDRWQESHGYFGLRASELLHIIRSEVNGK